MQPSSVSYCGLPVERSCTGTGQLTGVSPPSAGLRTPPASACQRQRHGVTFSICCISHLPSPCANSVGAPIPWASSHLSSLHPPRPMVKARRGQAQPGPSKGDNRCAGYNALPVPQGPCKLDTRAVWRCIWPAYAGGQRRQIVPREKTRHNTVPVAFLGLCRITQGTLSHGACSCKRIRMAINSTQGLLGLHDRFNSFGRTAATYPPLLQRVPCSSIGKRMSVALLCRRHHNPASRAQRAPKRTRVSMTHGSCDFACATLARSPHSQQRLPLCPRGPHCTAHKQRCTRLHSLVPAARLQPSEVPTPPYRFRKLTLATFVRGLPSPGPAPELGVYCNASGLPLTSIP